MKLKCARWLLIAAMAAVLVQEDQLTEFIDKAVSSMDTGMGDLLDDDLEDLDIGGEEEEQGRGIAQSNEQAVLWFRKSAEQGYAPAQWQSGNVRVNKVWIPFDRAATKTANDQIQVLIRSDDIDSGDLIAVTHLPNAVSGLKVKIDAE